MISYPYSSGSLLDSPQNYMYTPYSGAAFVSDWYLSRDDFLIQYACSATLYPLGSLPEDISNLLVTDTILKRLCVDLRAGLYTSEYVNYWLPRLLKKFEVSKRLYHSYSVDAPHVKIVENGFDNLTLYLLLAESLIRAWANKPMSQYINGLLKLVDTLLSQISLLDEVESSSLAWIVLAERTILEKVMINLELKTNAVYSNTTSKVDSLLFLDSIKLSHKVFHQTSQAEQENKDLALAKSHSTASKKILLLCGHTSRSVAYIQALSKANVEPDSVIVYGAPKGKVSSLRVLNNANNKSTDLFSPNLEIDILQSLKNSKWQYSLTQATELHDPSLLALIDKFSPDLIIYSGYGGQLVPAKLLNNYPVLHIHSGWLPDYRGSTTLYYQILDENSCAASAILLDEQIDTGDIVARKRYPIPESGVDVDYFYDNMIRADLLVDTLRLWIEPMEQWQIISQIEDSLPYFIIHPLLKHLAILTVDKEKVAL